MRAINLTTEELWASKLPDDALRAVFAEFKSETGKTYKVSHFPFTDYGPYILLTCSEVDRDEFTALEKIIAGLMGGIAGSLDCEHQRLSARITSPHQLTQEVMAGLVEQYMVHFSDVAIPLALYRDVPQKSYLNSGLPAEKLSHM